MRVKLAIACIFLAIPLLLVGQEITGTIRGTVKDPSGAVVPNATVTVTNTDRNQVVRTVTSNSTGEYVAPLLPVGTYSLSVEAPGFKKFAQSGIVLNVSDRRTVDATLQTGGTTESVSVEANPVQVDLQNAAQEGLINGTQVRELPLNNRNYEQLVTLQPGVTSNASDQIYVGTTNPTGQVNIVAFSVNGNRQSQNNWTIDGADNVDHGSNITLLVYPSVDSISEFKVLRSNYSPEYGRSASGQVNVITRAGTNGFHGSLYEFFRNDALNANDWLSNHNHSPKKVLRYNDFGGTIGGPVFIPHVYNGKDKTFFFFSEEARRVTTPVQQVSTVPTLEERQGIFSSPVCTAIDATGNCTAVGTQITNINPISQAYLQDVFSKIPAPQDGRTLTTTFPGIFNYREELVRLDHIINSKLAVMGRFVNDSIPTQEPFGLFGPQSRVPGVATTKTDSPGRQFMGRLTWQLNNAMFNEAGYAYSYGAILSDPTGALSRSNSPNVAAAVTLPYPVTLNRIPNVFFDDALSNIGGFGPYRDFNRNHNIFDNFSWVHGKHSFKFGFSYNHYQKKENAAGNNVGSYTFGSQCTDAVNGALCDTITDADAQDFANLLLGFASSSFVQSPIDTTADIRQNLYEGYAQDEYRIKPNLTLSYGLRYSFFQTPYSGGSTPLTSFDPSVYNPANAPQLLPATDPNAGHLVLGTGDPLNGIIISGQNSPYGSSITRQDKKNFAPRIGIAWDPFKTGKTSVRAGYGIFYDSVGAGLIEDNVFNNPPFLNGADFGPQLISSITTAQVSDVPPSIWTTAPNWHTPYSQQWSLDIQQEFGRGFIGTIGYVGNKGTHLVGVQDINQVFPGAAVAAGLATPGVPVPNRAADNSKLNLVRPFRGYTMIGQIAPEFDSNYNSLQTSLTKRFTGNTTFGINYTWSKALTDNQTDRSTGLQDTYCRVCDYGRSQLDRRHVFTANYVYDLPFLKAQEGVLGHILGGWEASGILTVNSGLPFTVFAPRSKGDPAALGINGGGAPNNGSVATPRPDQIGNPNSGAPHGFQWIDASAFAFATGGAPGTERRGAVNGPGLWRYDMAMMKNIKTSETTNLQFRAEAFNLFNHANFQSFGTTLPANLSSVGTSASTFGQITAVRDPRIMQLALKFLF